MKNIAAPITKEEEQAELEHSTASARDEYERAKAAAWAELKRDRAAAWVEYWRFHASLDGAAKQLSKWEAEYNQIEKFL